MKQSRRIVEGAQWEVDPATGRGRNRNMHSAMHYALSYRFRALASIVFGLSAVSVRAAETMPAAQQNALVQKYCAVCHTDAANNGGLSLERFDAAQAAPSLTAMLLSKLTGGASLRTVGEISASAGAAALVDKKMKSGAMGAAGIPRPDKATIDALIQALQMESTGATEWAVQQTTGVSAAAPVIEASILREVPSAKSAGEARAYRLIATCDVARRRGFLQVAWSPLPQRGTLAVSVDGSGVVNYPLGGVTQDMAALILPDFGSDTASGLPLPAETLTITDLFPGETVAFPFANLPQNARTEFQACFAGAGR
jgi:hypothetical protein